MTKSYEELLTDMTEIIAKIHDKGYDVGYEQGKFDKNMENRLRSIAKVSQDAGNHPCETAQEKRDRIVEKAKKDVRKLVDDAYRGEGHATGELPAVAHIGHVKTEFIVNKEKRTVVALLRYKYIVDGVVRLKGIAKCASNDCFNAHIGKAIALRRALGLDVLDEYYTAPQPTDVRIGDIIKSTRNWPEALAGPFYVGDVFEVRHDYDSIKYACAENSAISKNSIIIDDSREGGVN